MGQTVNFHRELTLLRRSVGMGMALTVLFLLLPGMLVSPMEPAEEAQTIQPIPSASAVRQTPLETSADQKRMVRLLRSDGGVEELTICGAPLSGTAIRSALGLRSATFTAAYENGKFVFSVTGFGHGVGLSQYGANTLAAQGLTYREILEWYYTDISIES